jgi:hypothetical protein
VVFWVDGIVFRVGACPNPVIGSSNLRYNIFFAKGLTCGFCVSPADDMSTMGKTGLYSENMWYDREYVARHIGEIGIL